MPSDILQFILYAAAVTALAWPLGLFMARLYTGQATILSPALAPVEGAFYRLAGIDRENGQHWTRYALSVLAFSLLCWAALYDRKSVVSGKSVSVSVALGGSRIIKTKNQKN